MFVSEFLTALIQMLCNVM